MRDFVGNILTEGDKVAYLCHTRTSSCLARGVVIGFTPQFVKVEHPHSYRSGEKDITRVSADKIVKVVKEIVSE